MSSKLKNSVLFIVVLLVFQEVIVRIAFPIPEVSNFDRANYIPGAEKGNKYPFYRNTQWVWESALDTNYQFVHELNQYGFRDQEWKSEKPTDKKRVLIIGDSFVEGIMAEVNSTIKAGFKQNDLSENYEVLNMGIMGVGINSYLQLTTDAIGLFKPDIVCLLLYSNDLTSKKPIIPTQEIAVENYSFFTPRLIEIYRQAQQNSSIPFRWEWKRQSFLPQMSDKNFPWLGRENVVVEHTTAEVRNSMIDGRTNPFKLNQILREQKGLLKQPNFEPAFEYLNKLSRKNKVQLVVGYIPARHQITNYYYQFDKAFCKKDCPEKLDLTTEKYNQHQKYLEKLSNSNDFEFLNFSSFIQREETKNNHLYWNFDDHMKGKGYLLLGNELFNKVEQLNDL